MKKEDEEKDDSVDIRQQSITRFESRFGNLKEFKRKVEEEHKKNCKNKNQCLICCDKNDRTNVNLHP